MNEREQISALVDDELSPADRDALLGRMGRDPALADTWRRYQLVRAALQHEAPVATDLSGRVMAALSDEPVVLAPRAMAAQTPPRPHWLGKTWVRVAGGMALAASLTFAITSLLQTGVPGEPGHDLTALYQAADHPQVLVTPESAGLPDTAVAQVALNDNDRENAYLLAHAEYSERGLDDGIMPFARVAGQSEEN
jgi:sigma-E factor negative regulatory protein RseA